MSELPPLLLLLDLSAVLAGQPREWQEFSRLGQCLVPQAVYQELQALSQDAIEKTQELTARAFMQFFPDSGWQLCATTATHPALMPTPGQRESKRARLALAVAECAYGLARMSAGQLVVLVANDPALVQRLHTVQAANLCGLPLTTLLNWSRSSRRPAVVTQQMQAMKTLVGAGHVAPHRSTAPKRSVAPRSVALPTTKAARPLPPLASAYPSSLAQIISTLSALVAMTIAAGVVWYVVQPRSLNQFLQQLQLPPVPDLTMVKPARLSRG